MSSRPKASSRGRSARAESWRPKVSVVITAYNVERFVAAAIDSALDQDWPTELLEIVVVNDGSTDSTPEILASYGDRITVITQENKGCMAAAEAGLTACTGDLIAYLDGDDLWPRNKLRIQTPPFRDPEVGLVYGDMELIDAHDERLHVSYLQYTNILPPSGRILGTLLSGNYMMTSSLMFRASLRDRYLPFAPEAAAYDWWVASRIAEASKIYYLNRLVARYRNHGSNMYLGQSGDNALTLNLRDVVFTRHILRTYDVTDATSDELFAALLTFIMSAARIAELRGEEPANLIKVSDDDHAQSVAELERAMELAQQGHTQLALRSAIRAVAHDPRHYEADLVLDRIVRYAVEYEGLHQPVLRTAAMLTSPLGMPGSMPVTIPEPSVVTRKVAVLADGWELCKSPDLLQAWTNEFTSSDDVTLVVTVDPAHLDEVATTLQALAGEIGLDAPHAPEVVLHECRDPSELGIEFSARLSHRQRFGLPTVGTEALRRHVLRQEMASLAAR